MSRSANFFSAFARRVELLTDRGTLERALNEVAHRSEWTLRSTREQRVEGASSSPSRSLPVDLLWRIGAASCPARSR